MTEERVREIAEEASVEVARQLRLASFHHRSGEMHEYDEDSRYITASRIIFKGEAAKYNDISASILKAAEQAAGWTDEEADDPIGDCNR